LVVVKIDQRGVASSLNDTPDAENSLLRAALAYASRGWSVLPLHTPEKDGTCSCRQGNCGSAGKHPRTLHGLKDASTDAATIRNWWATWPRANVGVATGPSGLVVLDVDPDKGGDESLGGLVAAHEQLPTTVVAVTGGGGGHYFFRNPGGVRNSAGNLGDGLDIRGEGGYVVVPPSLHASGRQYAWEVSGHPDDVLPADPPEWLVGLAKGGGRAPRESSGAGTTAGAAPGAGDVTAIPEGKRNDILFRFGCELRARGLSDDLVLAALHEANAERCDPPLDEGEVRRIAASVARYARGEPRQQNAVVRARRPDGAGEAAAGARTGQGSQSQATLLVELVTGGERGTAELFHDAEGEAYATMAVVGDGGHCHKETHRLRSGRFRDWLAHAFYREHGKAAGAQAMQDALGVLAGQAIHEGACHAVHLRLAEYEGAIYLDLCDDRWRAVRVAVAGWEVVDDPLVKFRRMKGMLPLPEPVGGGRIEELWPFLNLDEGEDEGAGDRTLVAAWLLAALRPVGPYPLEILHGEQGSAKTTFGKVQRALVDPHVVPLRAAPKEERDLVIAANNSRVVAFDNLSRLSEGLSDALCRLATGGGFGGRKLYTDDEEALFNVQRPTILNGIEELATRGDLLDRGIGLTLPAIPDERRRTEAEFWRDFEAARARILGALLDGVAAGLRNLPHVHLRAKPRMADFVVWAHATLPGVGLDPETFDRAYLGNRTRASAHVLEASALTPALRELVQTTPTGWRGTATELLKRLEGMPAAQTHRRDWPKDATRLSGELRRLLPQLRRQGIEIEFKEGRAGGVHTRVITVRKVRRNSVDSVDRGHDEGGFPSHAAANGVHAGVEASVDAAWTRSGSVDAIHAAPRSHHAVTTGSVDTISLATPGESTLLTLPTLDSPSIPDTVARVNARRAARGAPPLSHLFTAAMMGWQACLGCGRRATFHPGEWLVCDGCQGTDGEERP
jgi:hypothetical protein